MTDLSGQLTMVRGAVRRLAHGVPKQQHSIVASQLEELSVTTGEAAFMLRHMTMRQAALMAGQPLPVISCIEEHAPHIWALIQEARQSQR